MSSPARFTEHDLTRPSTGMRDATTDLLDFAIITWAIDPAALAEHLPDGLWPDTYTLDDGREVAFISAVPFRDHGFHFKFAPFYKIAMGQTNYRAYVKDANGARAVWFFGTTLTGFWVRVPRDLWKLPWESATMDFDVKWSGAQLVHYKLIAHSDWAPAVLELTGTHAPMGRLDGFANEEETGVVLTHPLTGYYYRRDGEVGSYRVWHDQLELKRARVIEAKFPLFERLGLIDHTTPVHSALVQPVTQFIVFLPPVIASNLGHALDA